MTSRTRTDGSTGPTGSPTAAADDLTRLVQRVAGGDQAAFELLYRAISAPVYGVALRTLRSPAHAEEVAQEVLLEVWRTASAHRPERGSVMTWALTIAHHRAVDRVRSARASAERDHRAGLHEPVQSEPPEDQAVRSLDRQRVRSALSRLTEVQREALVLAYYGGYTQQEIAHRTGVPLGTVKTRIRDGLIRLRTFFAPDRSGPAAGEVTAGQVPRTVRAAGGRR